MVRMTILLRFSHDKSLSHSLLRGLGLCVIVRDADILLSAPWGLPDFAVPPCLYFVFSNKTRHEPRRSEHLLCGLLLMEPKPDVSTVYAVIRTTVVVDLWARLLSITIKAILAVVSVPGSSGGTGSSSSSNAAGLCNRGRLAVCGHRVRVVFRGGGGAEGGARLRESPLPRDGRSSTFDADDVNGSGDGDRTGGEGGGRGVDETRRMWRACLCCSERFFGGPYRFGPLSTSGGDGNDAGEAGRTGGSGAGGTGILLSRAGRQVNVCTLFSFGKRYQMPSHNLSIL